MGRAILAERPPPWLCTGHSHLYGVTWPMANGQKTQDNYTNPRGTVYITEGNVRVLLAYATLPN